MKILEGIILNCLLSVFLLITVIGLGRLLLSKFPLKISNDNLAQNLATWFATGLAVYTVILHLLATLQVEFRWFIMGSCISGLISFAFYIRQTYKTKIKEVVSLLFLGSILGIWAYLPGLVTLFNSGLVLGMVTRGNNDIAYYVAVANEFLKTGFVNSNHISSIDLNFVAANSHYFAPTALFTLSNGLTSLESWQVAMFVMIASFCFAWLALAGFSRSIFGPNVAKKSAVILVSTVTMLSGLTVYIYGNYFLAQILSIGITALILTNCYEFFVKKDQSIFQISQTVVLTILSLFTYPHILVPFIILSAAFTISLSYFKARSIRLTELAKFSIGIFLGVLLSKNYLHFSKFLFESMTGGGTAGWPLPALNPAQIIFWPQLLGWPTPKTMNLLLWVIFFSAITIIVLRLKAELFQKFLVISFCLGGSVAIIFYVVVRSQNFDAYTSWKLISYLLPLVSILFLSYIGIYSKNGIVYLLILFGVTSMSPALMWSQAQWKSLTLGVSLNSDMAELASSKLIIPLKTLNLDVDPMFETMALSAMIPNARIFPNASSYFPVGNDPNSCTLVRSDSRKFPYMIRINNSYSLASSVNVGCSAQKPFLEIGKEYFTNSNNQIDLNDGWSPSEAWGTWSVGERSSFKFQADFQESTKYFLVLKTAGFVTTKNDNLKVRVSINDGPPKEILFTTGRQKRKDFFELIPSMNFSDSKSLVHVSFIIEGSKSPQELGLSDDTRKLGIGLLSVEIMKK